MIISIQHFLCALLLVSGVALILCARYLFDRADRCEVSTRAAVAALLGFEGAIAIMLAVSSHPLWWGTAACASLTALTAWIVIGTRYGRRCARIDGWGITRPDDLSHPDDAHEVQQ